MKTERVKCDYCGHELDYPAMFGVSGTVRMRVGACSPQGYAEMEFKDKDFCDPGCMERWLSDQHAAKNKMSKVFPWERQVKEKVCVG